MCGIVDMYRKTTSRIMCMCSVAGYWLAQFGEQWYTGESKFGRMGVPAAKREGTGFSVLLKALCFCKARGKLTTCILALVFT